MPAKNIVIIKNEFELNEANNHSLTLNYYTVCKYLKSFVFAISMFPEIAKLYKLH